MNLSSNTNSKALLSVHLLGKAFARLSILTCLASLSAQISFAQANTTSTAQDLSPAIAESIIQAADSGEFQASIHKLELGTPEQQIHMDVEIVATNESRAQGLMYRFDLPQNYGMLFVFPNSERRCFWMKNTYIPLSIAYINEHGQIVSIHDMQPHDVSSVCSLAPAMYALETKQGWYQEQKIKIGDSIRIKQTTSQ